MIYKKNQLQINYCKNLFETTAIDPSSYKSNQIISIEQRKEDIVGCHINFCPLSLY